MSGYFFMKGKIMEENQIQNELETSTSQAEEPIMVDNSEAEIIEEVESTSEQIEEDEGQSFDIEEIEKDPSEKLILGKFKAVEDLVKAYEELQKRQGQSSQELGDLRKEIVGVNEIKEKISFLGGSIPPKLVFFLLVLFFLFSKRKKRTPPRKLTSHRKIWKRSRAPPVRRRFLR
jgi:hypothetical protein